MKNPFRIRYEVVTYGDIFHIYAKSWYEFNWYRISTAKTLEGAKTLIKNIKEMNKPKSIVVHRE